MTLKEKLRQNLTGHLSDEKTEIDVNIAETIAEEFAIGFAYWCEWCDFKALKTYEELLEIYKKEKGL